MSTGQRAAGARTKPLLSANLPREHGVQDVLRGLAANRPASQMMQTDWATSLLK
jgi:hypothetical protein